MKKRRPLSHLKCTFIKERLIAIDHLYDQMRYWENKRDTIDDNRLREHAKMNISFKRGVIKQIKDEIYFYYKSIRREPPANFMRDYK